MSLDVDEAEVALERIADQLGMNTIEFANGIVEIVTTNMTRGLRLVTVENGYDPRSFSLTCFGGTGPLFTTHLANELDIEQTVVPRAPGVLSTSDPFVLKPSNADDVAAVYDQLEARAREVAGVGVEPSRLTAVAALPVDRVVRLGTVGTGYARHGDTLAQYVVKVTPATVSACWVAIQHEIDPTRKAEGLSCEQAGDQVGWNSRSNEADELASRAAGSQIGRYSETMMEPYSETSTVVSGGMIEVKPLSSRMAGPVKVSPGESATRS